MARIFVQIASYRDPELPYTVRDLLAKAWDPKAIRIGICNQATPANWRHAGLAHPAIQQIKIPYRESKGTCWARSRVQELYEGEEFTLQLDSHHRFEPMWDRALLEMLEKTGSPKPMLTAYIPGYDGRGKRTKLGPSEPGKQVFQQFDGDGVVNFIGSAMAPDELQRPPRARYSSGHFIFAPGRLIEEVPYDPSLYFMGEEITLAVRAFTHGFDLFHPNKTFVYHAYTRKGCRRHWDDHNQEKNKRLSPWQNYQGESVRRIRALLTEPESVPAPFGLGTVRSLRDYELYAGLSFKYRLAHQNTLDGLEPPSTRCWNWEWTHLPGRELRAEVKLDAEELESPAPADFWYFGLHDETGFELTRIDLTDPDYFARRRDQVVVHCWSRSEPKTYTVIPFCREKGWGPRITRPLTSSNFKAHFAS
ncbi:MAG TPA: GlcNAc-transferase family protein [Chthoniobacteraceae bacterium]|nr:GlcNAc-transferase family protein [Chthoniobacteraceae bacterium]